MTGWVTKKVSKEEKEEVVSKKEEPPKEDEGSKEKAQAGGDWKPTRGGEVWAEDVEEGFVKTLVYKVGDANVETEAGDRALHQCFPVNPQTQDGVPDHTMMDFLFDPNLLHNIQHRYSKDDIYSYIAYILIAVNPYKTLPIYTEDLMWKYRKGSMGSLPPHVFAIAERAYRHMAGAKASQSVICSGDSGAGKTETAKYLLRYLTTIAGGGSDSVLEKRILEANPVIEAFGNAKTLRNNNSSRFGKFVRVFFSKERVVVGAEITTYLLERSRLVLQPNKERNFHIFYQLLSGASADQRQRWLLNDTTATDHRYTNQSQCIQIDQVDDKADFKHVVDALTCAGISEKQQDQILSMVAALLHLGNITFEVVEKENVDASEIEESSRPSLNAFCKLVGISTESFSEALLKRRMVVGDQVFVIPLQKADAEFARDTLAKALYQRLFDYVVKLINQGMPINKKNQDLDDDVKPLFIGILDISGFEYFDNNGFEQFLINYCNEKIQQYFVHQILNSEQQIYLQEGLRWKTVNFSDNFKCLELIELKTHGLLSLLQEQCMLPKGSDVRFTSNLTKIMVTNEKLILCSKVGKKENIPGLGNRRFKNDEAFIVRHFAADVCYQTRGWLGKNNDGIHNDLETVLQSVEGGTASSSLLPKLYPKDGKGEDEWEVTPQGKGEKKSSRFSTISSTFQSHLNGLMETLDGTESHFIRCINPNLNRKPGVLNRPGVLTQLRCSGMLEALRIMQAGFPTRCLFTDLYARYKDMCPPEMSSLNPKLFSEALLVALDLEGGSDFQMGLSRVFFRAGKAAMMDDIINGDPAVMARVAAKIRKWLARKRWRQFIWGVISINRLGAIIEDMREEKRRQEEARRLASEEYQMELRRKREEEERLLQEELKRKEEEERRRAEEEERKRKEKLERKRAKEKELERLKKEAELKNDLQEQLHQQQEMYEEVKMELLDEISALEFELQEEREARLAVEKELTETRSRERALLEMKAIADGEVEKLRGEVSGLEDHLRVTQRQLHAAEEQLTLERENHKTTAANWENKYNEMVSFKDEEIERLKNEHAKQVADLKREMERMMEEMKAQADAQIAKMQEEKEESITRLEVLAEEKMTVLERTTSKVSKSGYLWKYEEGFMKNTWKKYYFVLKSSFLSWFPDHSCVEREPVGMIDLESARAYKASRKEKEKKKYEGCEFEIRSPTRVVNLRVDYARDVDAWVQAISMAKARYLSSGTVNLDKVSVAAVKQGLVGGQLSTVSSSTTSTTSSTVSSSPRG